MKLTINCTYCGERLSLTIGAHQTTLRTSKLTDVHCPKCQSIVGIDLDLKRRRQGKGYKEIVAKADAAYVARVEAAQKINADIGDRLARQPGCRCVRLRDESTHAGHSSGHWLASSWSRRYDGARDLGMIPNPPQHQHGCSLRNSPEERHIIASIVGAP